ncbi:luc7-like protein 3 [Artemisia annua]|uniref:Luc7-like protein 3 n=1 Tax=Artemisia annua TaxID=35608 RepID=A0A2U1MEY2_ARTAN|nr:luc7-like protein 3 [Artemisia annua]
MDLDRKVRRGRERLAQEVEVPPPPPMPVEKSEQLSILEEKIKNLLESVEALGEAGKVDEAEALMRKVDLLNIEKTALTLQPHTDKVLMLTQEKKMALCETCGSFLIANDALERTQSHVTGKQHIGYGLVRDFLSEYRETKEKAREEERAAREKEAEERRKLREQEVDGRHRSVSADRDKNLIIIWEEHQIVGTIIIILEMEVTGTGIDTVGVTIADLVPLLGMGEDSHPEVLISEFCRLEVRRGRCLLYITTFYECLFKSLKKAIMSSWVNLFFVLTALLRLISYHQYN